MRLSLSGRTSLTVRLTVLFSAAASAVLLILGYLVASSVEQHFEAQDMTVLSGKLELVEHALGKARSGDELARVPAQLTDSLVGHHKLNIMVIAQNGAVLFATKGAQFPKAMINAATPKVGPSAVWRKLDGHPVRGIVKLATSGIASIGTATIAVATDIGDHEHFMEGFQRTLWGVAALGAILTGLLGWAAARPVRIFDHDKLGIELQVENVGEGIAAEHLPRLFERFYRVDFARQRQSDGAGLGLAITRSIVRAHGGEATVSSTSGLTTFGLKFPA